MSIETTILLSNISTESLDLTFDYSDKQKGAGYHKSNDGMHTVVYAFDEFAGTVKIQATLELYPGDNDWFDVAGTELGGDSTLINSSALSYTFTGRFVWIRAAYNLQSGTITQIRYNY
jgi:hypothetical protein